MACWVFLKLMPAIVKDFLTPKITTSAAHKPSVSGWIKLWNVPNRRRIPNCLSIWKVNAMLRHYKKVCSTLKCLFNSCETFPDKHVWSLQDKWKTNIKDWEVSTWETQMQELLELCHGTLHCFNGRSLSGFSPSFMWISVSASDLLLSPPFFVSALSQLCESVDRHGDIFIE